MLSKRRLGRTDFEITPIGLGCLQFAGRGLAARFYASLPAERVRATIAAALDGGVNWFDTAEMYGRGESERALTTALRDLGVDPGKVVIATKWSPGGRTARSIGRTIGTRLACLQGYPIDLHQIHMPYGAFSSLTAQVNAMADLAAAHRITAVGVSNFSAAQMAKAAAVLESRGLRLASNQVQISLLHRGIETNGVLKTARELGVTLIAYSPLRSGLLTGRFHDDPAAAAKVSWTRRTLGHLSPRTLERTRPLIDELRAIGRAYGVSAAQVAVNWVITNYGDTVVAIPGASKPSQATESAAVMDFTLTDAERSRLADTSRLTRV
jgi:aryl-alcohol dehydrogenase-like predicted oxidoreductase